MSVTNVMLIFFISFLYTLIIYNIYSVQNSRPCSLPYIMQPLSFNPYPSCRA